MKKLLTILMLPLAIQAGLLDVPVRQEVRNSLVPAVSWVDAQYPSGIEVLGTVASAITGWGFPVGSPTNFGRVTFPLRSSVDGYVPTAVRVRVREGDYTGAILADITDSVALEIGVRRNVSAVFDTTVTNASATNLWVEIITNGRIDEYQTSVISYPTPTARYWTDANVTSPAAVPLAAVTQRNYPVTFYREDTSAFALAMSGTFATYVNGSDLISRIATPSYGLSIGKTIGAPDTVNLWAASTFSGSGQYIGNITNANTFSFWIYPWDDTALPSQVRVHVREMPTDVTQWTNNPNTWTIVATKTIDIAPPAFEFFRVDVRFGDDVYLTGNYWFEYLCNGKDRGRQIVAASYTESDPPGLWYVTGSSLDATVWSKSVSTRVFPMEIGRGSTDLSSYTVTDEFKRQLGGVPSTASAVLTMAQTYYALEGVEANVYFDNIIMASTSLDLLNIDIAGSKGAQYGSFGGFWRYTPTLSDTGTVAMSTVIIDPLSNEVLATNSWNLVTTRTNYPTVPVTRQLLCIGDSTLGGSGAAVLAELVRLFSGDTNYTLNLVGSNDGPYADSLGTNHTVRCEAISGWKSTWFYTNSITAWTEIGGTSRTGSPFVFSGSFNLTSWAATNSITLSSNDWVLIHLGINDVFSYTTDNAAAAAADTCNTYLESIITGFRALVPNIRVMVCLTIPPNASQDGFGASYGVGQTRARYKRNRDLLNERLFSKFAARTGSRIHLIDYGSALDSVNNYTKSATVANSRSAVVWNKATAGSGVHPDPTGYYQLSDQIRAVLKGNE